MAHIYENDVTKVGGNLQKTVAYLLSLHKAEYEWNMLGIKVVGTKEALPIPDGTYEYGDAYMIGNKTNGFEMWIYTRADEFHTDAYWFDIGQFPQSGPKGPKGDGIEAIDSATTGTVQDVDYNIAGGATVTSQAAVKYIDSADGTVKTQDFQLISILPIKPGKYISMDATADKEMIEVKVDDADLALDFYKINRSIQNAVIPFWNGQNSAYTEITSSPVANSAVRRNSTGDASFNKVGATVYCDSALGDPIQHWEIMRTVKIPDNTIPETPTDTGVLTAAQYEVVTNFQNTRIIYKNQLYYCMDPRTAPDGTLNFVHLDTVQTGSSYEARGKCFSITTSTKAWRVVDMSFGPRTHQVTITDDTTNAKTYMAIVSNRITAYTADELITEIGERSFPCTYDSVQADNIYAGVISALADTFTVHYNNHQEFNMSASQVTVTDYVV